MGKTRITLQKLLQIADKAYNNNDGQPWEDAVPGTLGDTLADFIIIELRETYDSKASRADQISEAHRVMNRAYEELGRVVTAFENLD